MLAFQSLRPRISALGMTDTAITTLGGLWWVTYGSAMAAETAASIVETSYDVFDIDKDTPVLTTTPISSPFFWLTHLATLPMIYVIFVSYGVKYKSNFRDALSTIYINLTFATFKQGLKNFLTSPLKISALALAKIIILALASFNALINTGPIFNAFRRKDNKDIIAGIVNLLPDRLAYGLDILESASHFLGLLRVYLIAFSNPLLRNPRALFCRPFPNIHVDRPETMPELNFTYKTILSVLFIFTLPSFVLRALFNGLHIYRLAHQYTTDEQTLPVNADGKQIPTPNWANCLAGASMFTQTTYLLNNLSKTAKILALWLHSNPYTRARLLNELGPTNLLSSIALACIMSPAIWANNLFATFGMKVTAVAFAVIGSIIYSMSALLTNQRIGQPNNIEQNIIDIDEYKSTVHTPTTAVRAINRFRIFVNCRNSNEYQNVDVVGQRGASRWCCFAQQ